MIIAYDGGNYNGWQLQKAEPTIQGVIEEALGKILNQQTRVVGSGRTDTGVHARNQVAHFFTGSVMDLGTLHRGLNSLLPPDVVIKEMAEVPEDFHARYSARSRIYQYLIWNNLIRSPFYQRFSWQVVPQLDMHAMREAARCLLGAHDFSSFQGTGSVCRSPVREVMRFTITGHAGKWIITTVEANSFLRHMVRNIMGTLVDVGKGTMSVEEFKTVLEARDRSRAGVTAPPQGLFLKEVKY